jgi:uncharacterized protein (UPF0332 family)
MKPEQTRAHQALRSAAALLSMGDLDGAINRAYYAMFHAARAALEAEGIEVASRKHGVLVGLFSQHLVKTSRLPRALGRTFNDAQKLRQVADYGSGGPAPQRADAEQVVKAAEEFVRLVDDLMAS